MKWDELTIAVIGGDEREAEIARLAVKTGAAVRGFGFPGAARAVPPIEIGPSAAEAARGADYLLLPIPGLAEDGSFFAPDSKSPIFPVRLLGVLAPGSRVIMGTADDELRTAAAAAEIEVCEYESDRTLMLERAPAIVEGAIAEAIRDTEVTIDGAEVAVVGYGNIGSLLARKLDALDAHVHVAARSPAAREAARSAGSEALEIGALPELAPRLEMLFSTVPAPVVGPMILEELTPGALVMDLAAPPGGVDLERARALGHTAVWARGLGRRAPITVGRSQWGGIQARIERFEAGRDQS